MKQLLLLRHAKSSWKDSELPDRERPLAPRGRRAAALMAEHLREQAVMPGLVLCSPALRARETLARIEPALSGRVSALIEPELYAASAHRLLERLGEVDAEVDSVLLIGHNPGLQELAIDLAGSGEQLDSVRRRYPTGALATLEFAGSWRDLRPGCAELVDFVSPQQLADR